MATSSTPQPTPAHAWKKQVEMVTLPSGNVAALKKPSVLNMLMTDGDIPEAFARQISDSISGNSRNAKPTNEVVVKQNELPQLIQFADRVCVAAFINPCIVQEREPDYDNGEIALDDVNTEDRLFVMAWSMGETGGESSTTATTAFPEESPGGVSTASDQ